MSCIIGEVDEFIVKESSNEFIRYSMTIDEMLSKLKDNNLTIINSENNEKVINMIKNNIVPNGGEYLDKELVGIKSLYYDSLSKKVIYGEVGLDIIKSTLMMRNLKYCFITIEGSVRLSENTPKELMTMLDSNDIKSVKNRLATNLYLDVKDKNNLSNKVRITADYNVVEDKVEDGEPTPIIYGNLESIFNNQLVRERNLKIINTINTILKDIKRNGLISDKDINNSTYESFKSKLIRTIERRSVDVNCTKGNTKRA